MKTSVSLISSLVVATALLLTSCKSDTPAETLYSRMGGVDTLSQVVDTFLVNVAADPQINGFFQATTADPYRLLNLRNHLIDQLCQTTGGPCVYKGKTMYAAHEGMNITDAQFDAFTADLGTALDANGVDPADKTELLDLLAPFRADIINH